MIYDDIWILPPGNYYDGVKRWCQSKWYITRGYYYMVPDQWWKQIEATSLFLRQAARNMGNPQQMVK